MFSGPLDISYYDLSKQIREPENDRTFFLSVSSGMTYLEKSNVPAATNTCDLLKFRNEKKQLSTFLFRITIKIKYKAGHYSPTTLSTSDTGDGAGMRVECGIDSSPERGEPSITISSRIATFACVEEILGLRRAFTKWPDCGSFLKTPLNLNLL